MIFDSRRPHCAHLKPDTELVEVAALWEIRQSVEEAISMPHLICSAFQGRFSDAVQYIIFIKASSFMNQEAGYVDHICDAGGCAG
jgi:hypothetical protein